MNGVRIGIRRTGNEPKRHVMWYTLVRKKSPVAEQDYYRSLYHNLTDLGGTSWKLKTGLPMAFEQVPSINSHMREAETPQPVI